MIAVAHSTIEKSRAIRLTGVLVLEPPRHTDLPLSVLVPGKHLIGTSDDCTIHLTAEGVAPRHAMILVGDQKILLKSLHTSTWVNDSIVSETTLRPGDRLSIGPITFRVRMASSSELLEFLPKAETEMRSSRLGSSVSTPESTAGQIVAIPSNRKTEAVTNRGPSPDSLAVDPPVPIPVETISVTPILNQTSAEIPANVTESVPVIVATRDSDSEVPLVASESEIEIQQHPAKNEPHLREIQQQIEALNEQSELFQTAGPRAIPSSDQQLLGAREEELKQLAAELSRQSLRLRDRNSQIAERETEVQKRQAQLAIETERLVAATQSTREQLADEYDRQMKLWQEWDSAYRRTTAELKTQLETLELRRSAIHVENERLAAERAEIQRLQTDHEDQRRVAAAERVQATNELGTLQSQRAAFETERRQKLAELQEREAQVACERRALAVAQDELLAARQQIEHDRTVFATERSSESLLREQELREHTIARTRLNEEASSLQASRFDLDSDRRSLDDERTKLAQEKAAFEVARAEVENLRTQLNQVQTELNLVRQSEQEKQARIESAETASHRRQLDLEQWQQTLEAQQVQLESVRNSIRLEQQAITAARTEFAVSVASKKDPVKDGVAEIAESHVSKSMYEESSSTAEAVGKLLGLYDETTPHSTNSVAVDHSAYHQVNRTSPDLGSLSIESLSPVPPPVPPTGFETSVHRDDFSARGFDTRMSVAHDESASVLGQSTSESLPAYLLGGNLRVETPICEQSDEPSSIAGIESIHELATAVEELPNPSIDDALSEINARFGFVSGSSDQSLSTTEGSESPIDTLSTGVDVENGQLIPEGAFHNDETTQTKPELEKSSGDGTLESLRAQLAQMFDLQSATSDQERDTSETTAASNSVEVPHYNAGSEEESSATPLVDPIVEQSDSTETTNESGAAGSVAEGANVECAQVEEPVEEETAWTRRLRELSAVADCSAAPKPPAPTPVPVEATVDSSNGSSDDDEFSVEAQLARLLGRPLASSMASRQVASPKPAEVPVAEATMSGSGAGPASQDGSSVSPPAVSDRSHLSEGPRHKQNKNAVRDEVQSFRAVAQMSARTALAKYSKNHLKSAFYFSSALTAASAMATAWFAGEWLLASGTNPWKGIACAIITIVSGHQLLQSTSRIQRLKDTDAPSTKGNSQSASSMAKHAAGETMVGE